MQSSAGCLSVTKHGFSCESASWHVASEQQGSQRVRQAVASLTMHSWQTAKCVCSEISNIIKSLY